MRWAPPPTFPLPETVDCQYPARLLSSSPNQTILSSSVQYPARPAQGLSKSVTGQRFGGETGILGVGKKGTEMRDEVGLRNLAAGSLKGRALEPVGKASAGFER